MLSMKKAILLFCILLFSYVASAQNVDTVPTPRFFRGQITATNNGISLIPNFSLNRPAAMFDLSLGKGRLSFDPMIRFRLDGKPWTFVFWWRYKLVQQKKFTMGVGTHPSVVFREVSVVDNGITKNFMSAQRYFAWEASPTYIINKNINFGLYYLGSHGLTKDIVQFTTFVAARSSINLPLSPKFTLNLIPQAYYLKMDDKDGTYYNITANLFKHNLPVSLNAVVSQAIQTEIGGKDFLWSVGLVYNINNTYLKRQ